MTQSGHSRLLNFKTEFLLALSLRPRTIDALRCEPNSLVFRHHLPIPAECLAEQRAMTFPKAGQEAKALCATPLAFQITSACL